MLCRAVCFIPLHLLSSFGVPAARKCGCLHRCVAPGRQALDGGRRDIDTAPGMCFRESPTSTSASRR
jgi:hypothetical protein